MQRVKGIDDLELSFTTRQLAISLLDSLRFEISSADSKQDLLNNSISVYDNAIGTAFRLYQQSGDIVFLHQAFKIAEKSKAFLLFLRIRKIGFTKPQ